MRKQKSLQQIFFAVFSLDGEGRFCFFSVGRDNAERTFSPVRNGKSSATDSSNQSASSLSSAIRDFHELQMGWVASAKNQDGK
ncbi:hypothetical protein [Brevibacillus choshinensis]|uniref:hypothetical protein n=1 Tax=Brevibacillus choshinensis TaxID=54911 RepID=UPI002E222CDF|nr:hypothetical protein [Brevibacillus choshinensis]